MKELNTYEDTAMAIQYAYEDELDNTTTTQELADIAIRCIELELPDIFEKTIAYIANEIVNIYKGADG